MKNENQILIYAGWLKEPEQIGILFSGINAKGNNTLSFEYSDGWLANHSEMTLDPDLFPYTGRQFLMAGKSNFGFLSDASPDRWGRLLMKRREIILAREQDRGIRNLSEIDFLLGVHEVGRVGGLRFKIEPDGDYLSNDNALAAPPWVKLRGLQNASLMLESCKDPYEKKWLLQLLVPGSSLGGARPKATVQDEYGNFWIAKFPSRNDEFNVGAWEKVVHDLAKECGLNVPESKIENFTEEGSTFLVKRFDRVEHGSARRHFASAMTMLGKTDGEDGSSYLDIAQVLKTQGSNPEEDLQELWRRIVFNVLVSNTDDHLRNHGFLLDKNGWRLSPVYDVNPNIYRHNLSLNITENSNEKDIALVLGTAKFYNLTDAEAKDIVEGMETVVHDKWHTKADEYRIPKPEQEVFKNIFHHERKLFAVKESAHRPSNATKRRSPAEKEKPKGRFR